MQQSASAVEEFQVILLDTANSFSASAELVLESSTHSLNALEQILFLPVCKTRMNLHK